MKRHNTIIKYRVDFQHSVRIALFLANSLMNKRNSKDFINCKEFNNKYYILHQLQLYEYGTHRQMFIYNKKLRKLVLDYGRKFKEL